MKLRWRFAFAALLTAAAPFAACSFPEVTYSSPDSAAVPSPESDSSSVEDSPSGEADVVTAVDAQTVFDAVPPPIEMEAGVPDAETRDDAEARLEAGTDGAGCVDPTNPCDCDGDKSLREDVSCLAPVGTKADCDDLDKLIRPNQSFVIAPWQSPHEPANDWNCDGTVEKQFPEGITCALLTACTEGFQEKDVPCGTKARYNFCQSLNLLGVQVCSVKSYEDRVQGCK